VGVFGRGKKRSKDRMQHVDRPRRIAFSAKLSVKPLNRHVGYISESELAEGRNKMFQSLALVIPDRFLAPLAVVNQLDPFIEEIRKGLWLEFERQPGLLSVAQLDKAVV